MYHHYVVGFLRKRRPILLPGYRKFFQIVYNKGSKRSYKGMNLVKSYHSSSHIRTSSKTNEETHFLYQQTPVIDYEKAKMYESLANDALQLLANSTNIHESHEHSNNGISYYMNAIKYGGDSFKNPQLTFNLALCQFTAGLYEEALRTFKYTTEKDSEHAPALRYVGDICYMKGEYLAAISFYDKVFEMFPRYYGREYGALKDPNIKREEISASIEEMLAYILFRRGQSYYHLKSVGGFAAVDFKAVLKLNTKHTPHALFWLGKIEDRNGNYWTAINFYDKSLKENPNAWDVFEAKANAFDALGKEDIAEECRIRSHLLKRKSIWDGQISQLDAQEPKDFDVETFFIESLSNNKNR